MMQHIPVLLTEALDGLAVQPDGFYLDATFGRGGHSQALLERLSDRGRLYACDRDPSSQNAFEKLQQSHQFKNCHFFKGDFSTVLPKIQSLEGKEQLDGIFLDLGVSSPQLDDPSRGFSFKQQGPLDMRMDNSSGISASQWLSTVHFEELAEVLKSEGEERYAKRIARRIIGHREKEGPIQDTLTLAKLVIDTIPGYSQRQECKHPATRTFQAIRIHVNRELLELKQFLNQAHAALKKGGRLVVISFHSLEDRIVKNFIHQYAQPKLLTLPWEAEIPEPQWLKVTKKPIRPQESEVHANPRARSALLRVAEKI